MYQYHSYYPPFSVFDSYPTRFAYPAINIKTFSHSVNVFSTLMHQGNLLLSHLSNPSFAHKLMDAAQHGKQSQVDMLVKSMGLRVPITANYSPTGIIFTLHSREKQHPLKNCCSLSFAIRWGD